MNLFYIRTFSALILLAHSAVFAANETLLQQAGDLIKQKNPQAAYELLDRHVADWSGDPQFDYLHGTAALDAGKPGLAVFSLERAVAVQPDFGGARMDLARAYFQLAEYQQARNEFNEVLKLDPPPQLKELVNSYLSSIDDRLQAEKLQWQASLEVGTGFDSNVTNTTELESYLGIPLSKESQATDSPMVSMKMNAGWKYNVSKRFTIKGEADLFSTHYPSATYVDTLGALGRGSLTYKRASHATTLLADARRIDVDGALNSYAGFISLQHRYSPARTVSMMLFGKGGMQRFDKTLSYRNTLQTSAGAELTFTHRLTSPLFLVLGGNYTNSAPRQTDSIWSYKAINANLTTYTPEIRGTQFYTSLNVARVSYEKKFFGTQERDDGTIYYTLGINHSVKKNWKLSPQITYGRNLSTTDIFEFEKLSWTLSLRRQLI